MKRLLDKLIPVFSRLPLLIVVALNMSVYWGARQIAGGWHHYNMQLSIEDKIPLLPWMVTIYFGCYIFWIVNYLLASRKSRETAWRFCLADILGKIVCFLFFILLPTTMERPEVVGNSIWDMGLRFLYRIDASDNLFPSIHCLVSWLCVIGIRKDDTIPGWYKILSVVIAVSVFISTLTLKQHVIVDVIAGVVLAELTYFITGKLIKEKSLRP